MTEIANAPQRLRRQRDFYAKPRLFRERTPIVEGMKVTASNAVWVYEWMREVNEREGLGLNIGFIEPPAGSGAVKWDDGTARQGDLVVYVPQQRAFILYGHEEFNRRFVRVGA